MAQFSLAEVISAQQQRTLRIPLTLVDSVSVDPRPWETLSQVEDLGAPLRQLDQIAKAVAPSPAAPPGPSGPVGISMDVGPSKEFFRGRQWQRSGSGVIGRVGPPGEQVFAHVSTGRPALRVDLRAAAPYIGFFVAHRDPEAAAAELRAAILGQFQRMLDDQTRRLGPNHRDTLTTRGHVADWLEESGRVEEAVAQSRQLLDDQIRVLGVGEESLRTRASLAFRLAKTGRAEESISQFRQLVDEETRRLGPDHLETLGVRNYLVLGLAMNRRADEAESEYRRLADDQIRVLGPGNPVTSMSRNMLTQVEEWYSERRAT